MLQCFIEIPKVNANSADLDQKLHFWHPISVVLPIVFLGVPQRNCAKELSEIVADGILNMFILYYVLDKKGLGVLCELSARSTIQIK